MLVRPTRRQRFLVYLVLVLVASLWLTPMALIVKASLESNSIRPIEGPENYAVVLGNPLLPRFFLNSFVVAVAVVGLVVATVSIAGYAFSKLTFPLKEVFFYLILLCLTLPPAILLVPLFQTVKTLGLLNSYLALIGPETALLIPISLLLARNYFDTIPDEILEAATIDGCSQWQLFRRIGFPIARPVLITVAVYAFLISWNEYLLPLTFMRDEAMYTVTQAPSYYMNAFEGAGTLVYASLVIISVPSLVFFLIAQRYLVEGMTAGSTK